ncbi:ribosomal protein S6 glutaminyl transferase [Aeromonas phage BUCT695]|uniref:ribosomal protein S6 glutaminyl transferase n=1 Tax=Aeromonas phage BUCT695 TaxID=2908630 RepID=UPI0023299C78|nr:ribosomal protein S6 glutaminyl transferase [Aeromonas phage BUCT695]UIW10521.1 ATP-grasp enzyme [Aeromonas phage BUCT695]
MSRIAIISHAASDTVNELKAHMAAVHGVNLINIRREGSTFHGRSDDLIINYGRSDIPMAVQGQATILNNPTNVAASSSKTDAFRIMREAGIPTVESTNDRDIAQGWFNSGEVVYARKKTRGHSGEGIVVCSARELEDVGDVETSSSLVNAPLYTKAISEQRREFRVHVMQGQVTYVQQKRRRDGFREDPNYSNVVRNHHTGWIYATNNAFNQLNRHAIDAAINAVAALGLDFGAVDIITRRNDVWVLEVNTAPGMTGTNLETYAQNFLNIHNNQHLITGSMTAVENADDSNFALEAEPHPANPSTRRRTPEEHTVSAAEAVDSRPTPAQESRQPASPSLRHQGFYFLTANGEETVGQWDNNLRHFLVIGWEIGLSQEEVSNIRAI